MRGRPRKKGSSELAKLKKAYTARRKVVFSSVQKTRAERVKKYAVQVKGSAGTKGQKRSTLAAYKKKLRESHSAFKKQFPTSTKLKDTGVIRALLKRLEQPKF
jgi:hypothetical protein